MLIADRLGTLPVGAIPKATLALLILLATSYVVERSKKLQDIQTTLDTGFEHLASVIGNTDVERLGSSATAHHYMAQAVRNATRSVAHVALGRGYAQTRPAEKEAFYQALRQLIAEGKATYTYVTAFYDRTRWERVKGWLTELPTTKTFVGHYRVEPNVSMLTIASLYLLIIDEKEVIVRLPKRTGDPEEYLRIHGSTLVELFRDYFSLLWLNSEKISERTYDSALMDAIGQRLNQLTAGKP